MVNVVSEIGDHFTSSELILLIDVRDLHGWGHVSFRNVRHVGGKVDTVILVSVGLHNPVVEVHDQAGVGSQRQKIRVEPLLLLFTVGLTCIIERLELIGSNYLVTSERSSSINERTRSTISNVAVYSSVMNGFLLLQLA